MRRSQSIKEGENGIPGRGNSMVKGGLEAGKKIERRQRGPGIAKEGEWHQIWLETRESHIMPQLVGHD